MGVIRKLSQDLVNQIAAGEVIERPASAMKELVENAVDAGARRVEVQLEDGGRRLIRVVDDGKGIAWDDLPLAVASHATSKLGSLDDLFRVATLGFRGEALASIGSIAELRVASRPEGADGSEIEVRGGAASEIRPAGAARGTTVEVRNLFFNTPARRKFLKEAGGELRACIESLQRIALAVPGVAFRLSHEGKLCLETTAIPEALPPVERTRARVADLFGRELAEDLVPVESAGGGVAVGGLVALPRRTRGDSTQQFVMLDGRAIRDKLVTGAISQAYHGFLMTRRYPIVFMTLAAAPGSVDVNVHPAKLEVRFREPREVFPAVVRAIRSALEGARVDPVLAPEVERKRFDPQEMRTGAVPVAAVDGRPGGVGELRFRYDDGSGRRVGPGPGPGPGSMSQSSLLADSTPIAFVAPQSGTSHDSAPSTVNRSQSDLPGVAVSIDDPRTQSEPLGVAQQGAHFSTKAQALDAPAVAPAQAVTAPPEACAPHLQLASGYLVVETRAGFEVIDPHALHERILYEEFRARVADGAIEVQGLLVPEVLDLTPLEEATLVEARGPLAQIGLVVEPFGPRTAAIQAVPAILRANRTLGSLVRDLLNAVATGEGGGASRLVVLDNLIATMACKAAVKLGERLKPAEVESLLSRRAIAERSHLCPHGRPTALAFPSDALERQFKR